MNGRSLTWLILFFVFAGLSVIFWRSTQSPSTEAPEATSTRPSDAIETERVPSLEQGSLLDSVSPNRPTLQASPPPMNPEMQGDFFAAPPPISTPPVSSSDQAGGATAPQGDYPPPLPPDLPPLDAPDEDGEEPTFPPRPLIGPQTLEEDE